MQACRGARPARQPIRQPDQAKRVPSLMHRRPAVQANPLGHQAHIGRVHAHQPTPLTCTP
eukprot:1091501-Heterocapsa_arctica.AAC.1